MTAARTRKNDLARKTRASQYGGGRPKGAGPYTSQGISRVLCSRAGCGRRADHQWSACADGNVARPLCGECDVELNAVALRWWGDPNWLVKIRAYIERTEELLGRRLELDADLTSLGASQP